MNTILAMLSAHLDMLTDIDATSNATQAKVAHPILTGHHIANFFKGRGWRDHALAHFYNKSGFNPGHQLVDFYASFHNYLSTTALWEMPFRVIGALLGMALWYIANAIQWFYVISYNLLNIRTIAKYSASQANGHLNVGRLFLDLNDLGLAVFGLILIIYVTGAFFDTNAWKRYKNIGRNALIILFMLMCIPWISSTFSDGINSVAKGVFSGEETTENPQNNPNNFADQAFEDNVISVPMRMQNTKPGDDLATPHVYRFHGRAPIPGVDVNPVFVDLYQMPNSERQKWNGIGSGHGSSQTVPAFLDNYMSPEEAIDNDSITKYGKVAGRGEKNRSRMVGGARDVMGGINDATSLVQFIPGGGLLHNLTNEGTKALSDDYEKDFDYTFEYNVTSYGMRGGALGSHTVTPFQQFSLAHQIGSSVSDTDSITTKPFMRSYGYYSVNWLGIYVQLLMIILIIGAYLFKTFELVFKNTVMVVSSGIATLRNADNPSRVKSWFRDFFGIYEMAFMDIIMCYIAVGILYPAYHQFTAFMLVKSDNSFVANRWSIMVIDFIADLALYMVSIHGLKAVDNMTGSDAGGVSSGASSYFGSMLALRGGSAIARGVKGGVRLGVKGAEAPFKATRDLIGMKGAGGAFAGRNVGKKGAFAGLSKGNSDAWKAHQKADADTSGRKSQHNRNGGLNEDQTATNHDDNANKKNSMGNATSNSAHGALNSSASANDSNSAKSTDSGSNSIGSVGNATNNTHSASGALHDDNADTGTGAGSEDLGTDVTGSGDNASDSASGALDDDSSGYNFAQSSAELARQKSNASNSSNTSMSNTTNQIRRNHGSHQGLASNNNARHGKNGHINGNSANNKHGAKGALGSVHGKNGHQGSAGVIGNATDDNSSHPSGTDNGVNSGGTNNDTDDADSNIADNDNADDNANGGISDGHGNTTDSSIKTDSDSEDMNTDDDDSGNGDDEANFTNHDWGNASNGNPLSDDVDENINGNDTSKTVKHDVGNGKPKIHNFTGGNWGSDYVAKGHNSGRRSVPHINHHYHVKNHKHIHNVYVHHHHKTIDFGRNFNRSHRHDK